MSLCEVSHQADHEPYVCHRIQQVLITEFLWHLETGGLHEFTGALAVALDELVADHLACATL
jgi:pterin-4a-carbinolamine dehydratase